MPASRSTDLNAPAAAGLPPVMTIFGVIAFGVLFGLPGVVVAAPLLVVAMVLVQRLYIEDVLGDELPPHKPLS